MKTEREKLGELAGDIEQVHAARRLADAFAEAIGRWIDETPRASVSSALSAIDAVRASLVTYREANGDLMNDETRAAEEKRRGPGGGS